MNEKQYLRANKRVFLAVTIIFAYITLTMLAALAASHGDHFVRIMIQCLVSVGVIILSALGYLTRKKTHTCASNSIFSLPCSALLRAIFQATPR